MIKKLLNAMNRSLSKKFNKPKPHTDTIFCECKGCTDANNNRAYYGFKRIHEENNRGSS